MNWTSQKPTVPGWYWYRQGGDKPEIYELVMPHGADELMIVCDDGTKLYPQFLDGDWAGPIMPPGGVELIFSKPRHTATHIIDRDVAPVEGEEIEAHLPDGRVYKGKVLSVLDITTAEQRQWQVEVEYLSFG